MKAYSNLDDFFAELEQANTRFKYASVVDRLEASCFEGVLIIKKEDVAKVVQRIKAQEKSLQNSKAS